jgi:hypothetical protein
MTVYKRASTLQMKVMRSRPPSSHEPLEHSVHPNIILFFNMLIVGLLPLKKDLNQDRSLYVSYSRDQLRTKNAPS